MKRHPLIHTLFNLKGNPKACVLTEPMWGIPYNLVASYVSIYMYALGVTDSQIGMIASIGMVFQIIFSLLGGIITDKLGRRYTTLVFDFVSWSIPCIIWAAAQNFAFFAAAAIVNSVLRVTMNSWNCLLVEDCDKRQIINIYAWIYISGLISAFFAPLSGLLISRYELITTVRLLYVFCFILMTAKFIILYIYSTETGQGKIRMEETRHQSLTELFSGYGPVIRQILKTPQTMLTLGIMLIMSICSMVNSTFWSLAATERILIPAKYVGLFPFLRSIVMLVFFFTVVPRIKATKFVMPLITGFSIFIVSQFILVATPAKGYAFLILSILLEACSLSLINPLLDSMQVVLVDVQERARIISLLYVIVIALTSPFGWIAGSLSKLDRRLPFTMNILLLILGIILTYFAASFQKREPLNNLNQLENS